MRKRDVIAAPQRSRSRRQSTSSTTSRSSSTVAAATGAVAGSVRRWMVMEADPQASLSSIRSIALSYAASSQRAVISAGGDP